MQDELRRSSEEANIKQDSGKEGSDLISEILYWNWGRVVLSLVAFGAVLYASESAESFVSGLGSAIERGSEPMLAARKLEYSLE